MALQGFVWASVPPLKSKRGGGGVIKPLRHEGELGGKDPLRSRKYLQNRTRRREFTFSLERGNKDNYSKPFVLSLSKDPICLCDASRADDLIQAIDDKTFLRHRLFELPAQPGTLPGQAAPFDPCKLLPEGFLDCVATAFE